MTKHWVKEKKREKRKEKNIKTKYIKNHKIFFAHFYNKTATILNSVRCLYIFTFEIIILRKKN